MESEVPDGKIILRFTGTSPRVDRVFDAVSYCFQGISMDSGWAAGSLQEEAAVGSKLETSGV